MRIACETCPHWANSSCSKMCYSGTATDVAWSKDNIVIGKDFYCRYHPELMRIVEGNAIIFEGE